MWIVPTEVRLISLISTITWAEVRPEVDSLGEVRPDAKGITPNRFTSFITPEFSLQKKRILAGELPAPIVN